MSRMYFHKKELNFYTKTLIFFFKKAMLDRGVVKPLTNTDYRELLTNGLMLINDNDLSEWIRFCKPLHPRLLQWF